MGLPFVQYGVSEKKTLTDYVMAGLNKPNTRKRSDRIWPSQVAGCPRYGALAATEKIIEKESAAKKLYCSVGKVCESDLLEGWRETNILLFEDYILPHVYGLNMNGKVDGIVLFEGKIRVVEVKTCGTVMPIKPKYPHLAQASLYSAITGLPYVIYYLSRNIATWQNKLITEEFYFDFSPANVEWALFNAIYANSCIKNGVLPHKQFQKKSSKCGFCPFGNVCWDREASILKDINHEQIIKSAKKRTEDLLKPDAVEKRRNGVLKHLAENNETAATILNGSWDDLI